MNTSQNSGNTSDNRDKFREAGEKAGEQLGEQVARVLGEFVSIANDFSDKMESGFERGAGSHHSWTYNSKSDSGDSQNSENPDVVDAAHHAASHKSDERPNTHSSEDEWREARKYFQELSREFSAAASSALDGFSSGLSKDGNVTSSSKEWSGEGAREWLDNVAELLKQRDPVEFIDRMKSYCEPRQFDGRGHGSENNVTPRESRTGSERYNTTDMIETVTSRQERLRGLFADKHALDNLSHSQFDELYDFMQNNYQSALQLVRKK